MFSEKSTLVLVLLLKIWSALKYRAQSIPNIHEGQTISNGRVNTQAESIQPLIKILMNERLATQKPQESKDNGTWFSKVCGDDTRVDDETWDIWVPLFGERRLKVGKLNVCSGVYQDPEEHMTVVEENDPIHDLKEEYGRGLARFVFHAYRKHSKQHRQKYCGKSPASSTTSKTVDHGRKVTPVLKKAKDCDKPKANWNIGSGNGFNDTQSGYHTAAPALETCSKEHICLQKETTLLEQRSSFASFQEGGLLELVTFRSTQVRVFTDFTYTFVSYDERIDETE
ncbi:hypothetical protein BCR34DRAFT_592380 [Clohesyomyces aquaticus]|uniref:Uncharacterized protein n=1 Tax=Clohesyomyces aquaticus TaxID=1231657 RepID=A0A1Y1YTH5_9PLEO|nr:hypothetical protein BCR34DRAFT_592380 [Clohesyomyces aquaticus]